MFILAWRDSHPKVGQQIQFPNGVFREGVNHLAAPISLPSPPTSHLFMSTLIVLHPLAYLQMCFFVALSAAEVFISHKDSGTGTLFRQPPANSCGVYPKNILRKYTEMNKKQRAPQPPQSGSCWFICLHSPGFFYCRRIRQSPLFSRGVCVLFFALALRELIKFPLVFFSQTFGIQLHFIYLFRADSSSFCFALRI